MVICDRGKYKSYKFFPYENFRPYVGIGHRKRSDPGLACKPCRSISLDNRKTLQQHLDRSCT